MRVPATALLVTGCAFALAACGQGSGEFTGRVERVVDGDTIIVSAPGGSERVRYIGIDTPESVAPGRPVECFGPQASAANRRLVAGREVKVVPGTEERDRYGRLLAYVYTDDGRSFVNARLVRSGAADTLAIEPNTRYAAELAALRRRARAEGAGLWGACR
ncbi:MAG: thermonuclease family protein [Solirubrobacterales bacterium]